MKRAFPLLLAVLVVSCARPPSIPTGDRSSREAFGKTFVVSTQAPGATRAALLMIEKGGNIIDAFAAASFALAVERPQSTGIGGGGFLLFYKADEKKTYALDFRERAPLAAKKSMFQDEKGNIRDEISTEGILAAATPGFVAGVLAAHEKWGKLSRTDILAPAIDLAEKGFPVYPHLNRAMRDRKELLSRFDASKAAFLRESGAAYAVGKRLKQPDLAKTLRAIAERGRDGFYKGGVAEALVEEMKRQKGLVTQKDLDGYEVKFREPLKGTFHQYELATMPPPSSGGAHVLEILNILEGDDLRAVGALSSKSVHLTTSAMQLAYADRAAFLGDTDFVRVPIDGLVSKAYARSQRDRIYSIHALSSSEVAAGSPGGESTETTHFSLMDAEGNTVASTQTINGWFGSGVVVTGAGFILNNEMDDFSAKPGKPNLFGLVGSSANAIAPGKRPLSSMSPTIVFRDGNPVLALGSPGGSRIITCTTLTLLNYLEYGMTLYDAVAARRYHHQWFPDELAVEAPGFDEELTAKLTKMGHRLKAKEFPCSVQAVAREGDRLIGVADPRNEGLALAGR